MYLMIVTKTSLSTLAIIIDCKIELNRSLTEHEVELCYHGLCPLVGREINIFTHYVLAYTNEIQTYNQI